MDIPSPITEPFTRVQLAAFVSNNLKLQDPLSEQFLEVCFDNAVLFDKKQHDYGPTNIAAFGEFGCIVRMSDKIRRLANLYSKHRKAKVRESVHDTLRDIANYAVISIMWLTNKWPH